MFYRTLSTLFKLIFLLLFRGQFRGRENIPAGGPLILCSNHRSWLDPPFMTAIFPRRQVHFMAKAELFAIPVIGRILRRTGNFPVNCDQADTRAVRRALQLLKENKILGLFPEGTRSKNGLLQKPFNGVALLAMKSAAPVLPVAISGPYKPGRALRINIGRPLYFTPRHTGRGQREQFSAEIMARIQQLLNER